MTDKPRNPTSALLEVLNKIADQRHAKIKPVLEGRENILKGYVILEKGFMGKERTVLRAGYIRNGGRLVVAYKEGVTQQELDLIKREIGEFDDSIYVSQLAYGVAKKRNFTD